MSIEDVDAMREGIGKLFREYPKLKKEYLRNGRLCLKYTDFAVEEEYKVWSKEHGIKKSLRCLCRIASSKDYCIFKMFLSHCMLEEYLGKNLTEKDKELLLSGSDIGKSLADKIYGFLIKSNLSVGSTSLPEKRYLCLDSGSVLYVKEIPDNLKVYLRENKGSLVVRPVIEYYWEIVRLFVDCISLYGDSRDTFAYFICWKSVVTEEVESILGRCCPKYIVKEGWSRRRLSGRCLKILSSILQNRLGWINYLGVAHLFMKGNNLEMTITGVNGTDFDMDLKESIAKAILGEFQVPVKEVYICYNTLMSERVKSCFYRRCPDGEYIVTIY